MQVVCKSARDRKSFAKLSALIGALSICLSTWVTPAQAKSTDTDVVLDEQVVMVPVKLGKTRGQFETTIYKPPGSGPFPLLIMNGGKALGNPHSQQRDRFLALSREFVQRGYAVVIPMRAGFSKSSGEYSDHGCDLLNDGQAQADDLQSALEFFVTQSWVDRERILVAGQSYGGLATLAFGTRRFPGVKGLINFAGGLRTYGGNCQWRSALISAFSDYGSKSNVPSLWFYGENDSHFDHELANKLHRAYVKTGSNATLVAFGPFKKDAHGLCGSWDGVRVWWPEMEKFLTKLGMPTQKVISLAPYGNIRKTDYASLDNVDAIPYLHEKGRAAYRSFLDLPMPRAFAISSTSAWSWAEDGEDPAAQVLADCQKISSGPCKLYAVNGDVVWTGE